MDGWIDGWIGWIGWIGRMDWIGLNENQINTGYARRHLRLAVHRHPVWPLQHARHADAPFVPACMLLVPGTHPPQCFELSTIIQDVPHYPAFIRTVYDACT